VNDSHAAQSIGEQAPRQQRRRGASSLPSRSKECFGDVHDLVWLARRRFRWCRSLSSIDANRRHGPCTLQL